MSSVSVELKNLLTAICIESDEITKIVVLAESEQDVDKKTKIIKRANQIKININGLSNRVVHLCSKMPVSNKISPLENVFLTKTEGLPTVLDRVQSLTEKHQADQGCARSNPCKNCTIL